MKLIVTIFFLTFTVWSSIVYADQWAFSKYKEEIEIRNKNENCSSWDKWWIGDFPLTIVIDRNLNPLIKKMVLAGISEWNNAWWDYRFNIMSNKEKNRTPRRLFTHCNDSIRNISCNENEFSWWEEMIFFTEDSLPEGKLGQTEQSTYFLSNYYDTMLVTMHNNRRVSWLFIIRLKGMIILQQLFMS